MQEKLSGSQTECQPASVYISSGASAADEISLVDLFRVIARRKLVVVLGIIIAISLALLYVSFVERVYRTKAHLLPPQQKDIQPLLSDYAVLKNLGIERYTPDLVYKVFLRNINSQGMRREFFDKQGLARYYAAGQSETRLEINKVFESRFNKNLQVQADQKNPSFVIVSLAYSDPELSAQWLNQFVEFINQRTIRQLSNDINEPVQSEIKRVRYKLGIDLESARQKKQDRIVLLKEALDIARILGIEDAGYRTGNLGESSGVGIITVNAATLPLYQRGIKALEAEISVLESRKSEEPFTKGLREQEANLAMLEVMSVDPDTLSAVTIDSPATTPLTAEKPRSVLIMIVAVTLGVMGGIFMAFITEMFSKLRQEKV